MDITFITMHDLSGDGTVLYASDSVTDVLGFHPREVIGRPCFEYFHPEEIPFAKSVHSRGVHLDRAATLAYCSLRRRDGVYVRCECVFTVVYSVIVACTSLYRYTERSQGRALAAPVIRRIFSSSHHDPRYHMLSQLSAKFTTPHSGRHEPRAAMILNRFTRTLTVMYATHALSDILGIQAEEAIGRSFYECISEDCLQAAVDALERAKENDSIAYLRFLWRDPRLRQQDADGDGGGGGGGGSSGDRTAHHSREASTSSSLGGVQSVDGGVPLDGQSEHGSAMSTGEAAGEGAEGGGGGGGGGGGPGQAAGAPQSSVPDSDDGILRAEVEVEAVISCTSDGLVVILRRARDLPPLSAAVRGVFASPWAPAPLMPQPPPAGGPEDAEFMNTIRQVAVFAWSLRSINEDIMMHARPGPQPDGLDSVGGFEQPDSIHSRRTHEWEAAVARARATNPQDPQYM